MTLPAGTRIGSYEIVAPIGAGGMGEVYRARDTRLDREVAIKVLASHISGDPSAASRLTREARAVAAISHPNVLAIFDVGEHDGIPFVVTELLEGTTLRGVLADGALDPSIAVRHAIQIAEGLAAAHDQAIVHRDLKPENIFVTKDRRAKILDFGLARQLMAVPAGIDETRLSADTNPGIVMGTAGYMSPEQARGLPIDSRSDVFAFGAILFEMLAGRRAFQGATLADTMASVVRDNPPDLQQLNPAVPAALARIVSRCLAKDAAGRFRSAHDLSLALEAVSGAVSAVSTPSAPQAPAPPDKGIVVLPFENMSADADNEFFADGLTEEIISDLSKIHALRVISRTSAMQLKGRKGNLPSLVAELNVQYVLEGSVRKAGDRLRITAQLIDARADAHVWSDKYNGTLEDVFDIQERVARAIADALRVRLTADESREISRRPIANPQAYECYLRARSAMRGFDEPGLMRAIEDIEHGLALAGESVDLLALKGDAAWQLANMGLRPAEAQIAEVAVVVERLQQIDPGSHHAERLLGLLAAYQHRMGESVRRLWASTQADPGDTFTATLCVFGLALIGEVEKAAELHRRIRKIDPLEPLVICGDMWLQMMSGNFDEAVAIGGRDYRRWSDHAGFVLLYVEALASGGRVTEAVRVAEALERDRPDELWTMLAQCFRWSLQGDRDAIHRALTPERRKWASSDAQYSQIIAQVFALAGDADEAFYWLDMLIANEAAPYDYLAVQDPLLASLRSDPRWPSFIERARKVYEGRPRL